MACCRTDWITRTTVEEGADVGQYRTNIDREIGCSCIGLAGLSAVVARNVYTDRDPSIALSREDWPARVPGNGRAVVCNSPDSEPKDATIRINCRSRPYRAVARESSVACRRSYLVGIGISSASHAQEAEFAPEATVETQQHPVCRDRAGRRQPVLEWPIGNDSSRARPLPRSKHEPTSHSDQDVSCDMASRQDVAAIDQEAGAVNDLLAARHDADR